MTRRWKRTLLVLITLVVTGGCYLWFFGAQTMLLLSMWEISRRAPVVRQVPHNLQDLTIAGGTGTKLSYLGYEFEVPWDDLDTTKTRTVPDHVVLTFRSGNQLMMNIAPPREFINSVVQDKNQDAARQMYGDEALQSDYAMWSKVLEATPDKITLSTPTHESVSTSMLLVIKAIALEKDAVIYSIQTKDFKGFQQGDPQKRPRKIVADLLADDGGVEFLFLRRKDATSPTLTQAEINRVLQTTHKAGPARTSSLLLPSSK